MQFQPRRQLQSRGKEKARGVVGCWTQTGVVVGPAVVVAAAGVVGIGVRVGLVDFVAAAAFVIAVAVPIAECKHAAVPVDFVASRRVESAPGSCGLPPNPNLGSHLPEKGCRDHQAPQGSAQSLALG